MSRAFAGVVAASRRRTVAITAPAFRSQAVTDIASTTSHVATMPSGVASGDFLVMALFLFKPAGPAVVPTTPSGWTHRASHLGSDNRFMHAVYTRQSDGTDGSTLTMTTASAESSHAGIAAWSGTGGLDAFTDYGSQQNATTTPTVPSVTTTQANSMLVGIVIATASGSAATPASGWTERIDNRSGTLGDFLYQMEKVQAAAGASATAQPTLGLGGAIWTFTAAIKGL